MNRGVEKAFESAVLVVSDVMNGPREMNPVHSRGFPQLFCRRKILHGFDLRVRLIGSSPFRGVPAMRVVVPVLHCMSKTAEVTLRG